MSNKMYHFYVSDSAKHTILSHHNLRCNIVLWANNVIKNIKHGYGHKKDFHHTSNF